MTQPFRYDLNQIPDDYTVEVTNRFKGLDLMECLKNYGGLGHCTGVTDQDHPPKKEKWLSEEALQTVMKRREAKGKGEKENIYSFECRFPKKNKER